jgi:cold shock CspA family protein
MGFALAPIRPGRRRKVILATGQITRLVTEQGFGFIQETGATEDLFFHSGSLSSGLFNLLAVGQDVEFDKDNRPKRRLRALNVRPGALGG